MMNRQKFYEYLRKKDSGVFGTRLSQKQVDGLENLLDVWEKYFAGDRDYGKDELAYNLGTAYWETARTMQPIMERGSRSYFNKYEPGTRIGKILGNTQAGDGYRFRGAGHVQNTGRRNAEVSSQALSRITGSRVDFVNNPDSRLDPFLSALSLYVGNHEGWWTGKELDDYLDGVDEDDEEDFREFVNARRVVNGTDKARTIAGFAVAFDKALDYADYGTYTVLQRNNPRSVPTPRPKPKPDNEPVRQPEPVKRNPFFEVFLWIVNLFMGNKR